MIELRSDEAVLLAKVLRKAWLEGGVKRGLTGTVIVPDESGKVQILAQGPAKRLESFSNWCAKELSDELVFSKVTMTDVNECPVLPLSSKFSLADMPRGKANTPWREILESANLDVVAASTKLHSSDEGLV